jgi:DNA-binding IclR family transcriptional regulator
MRNLQREHNLAIVDEVFKICNAINDELLRGKVLLSNSEHTKEDEMRILINTFAHAKQLEVILETHVHAKRQGVEWTHAEVYRGIINTCTSVVNTWNEVRIAIVSMIDSGKADVNIQFFVGRLLVCMRNIQNMLGI